MGGVTLKSIDFQLGGKASQGATGWYIVDLTIQVDLDAAAPVSSRNYVSIATNGKTAAQVEFTAERVGDQPAVRWSTYELFSGSAKGAVFGKSLTLRFRNYLQIAGVRPGLNSLNLQLEQVAGVVVSSARILPGSGVSVGDLEPPRVTVDASPSRVRVRAGDTVSLRYLVASLGFPARDVGLVASASPPGLAVTESPSRFLGWVAQRVEETISFVALAPGKYTVTLHARGATGGSPMTAVHVDVEAR